MFIGTGSSYKIAGRVVDSSEVGVAGVTVSLDGSATDEVLTDAGGNYLFSDLPADGNYFVVPFNGGLSFSPGQHAISALTSDVGELNFTVFAPTAASVSVGGRVL